MLNIVYYLYIFIFY